MMQEVITEAPLINTNIQTRHRKKPKGTIRFITEWILGGVGGSALGYYIATNYIILLK